MNLDTLLPPEATDIHSPMHEAVRNEALTLIKQACGECPNDYNTSPDFKPHEWVVRSVMLAIQSADAEKDFVLEQMAEQHERDEQGMVKATVAAVLEAVAKDKIEFSVGTEPEDVIAITVRVDMDEQRTIWDRATCTPALAEEQNAVTWTYTKK